MRTRLVVIAVTVAVFGALVPSASAQPGRSKGSFSFDPNSAWERYSQGRCFFLISETNGKSIQPLLVDYAQKNGLRDEKVTYEAFMAVWPAYSEAMKSRFGGMRPPPGGGSTPPTPGAPSGSSVRLARASRSFSVGYTDTRSSRASALLVLRGNSRLVSSTPPPSDSLG